MSNSAFASGWSILSGTLGTDVLLQDTVSLSGNAAIHFPSTASADAIIVSDWAALDDMNGAGVSRASTNRYGVRLHMRSSSTAANKDVRVVMEFTDKTKTTIYTNAINAVPLPVANEWLAIGWTPNFTTLGASVRFIRFKVNRPTDIDFDLYLDSVEAVPLPPYAHATFAAGTFPATWTAITPSLTTLDYNQVTISGTVLKLWQPGLWTATACLEITDTIVAGDLFGIRLGLKSTNGAIGAAGTFEYATQMLTVHASYVVPTNPNLGLEVSNQNRISAYYSGGGAAIIGPGEAVVEVMQPVGVAKDYDDVRLRLMRVGF